MTIWILALACLGAAGYVGYTRRVIRVAMSLVGILLGFALAPVLGPLLAPVMRRAISIVVLADALAPLAVFLIISIGFKVAAGALHNKVEQSFRYKATDTRLIHWERLTSRLGGCLGLLNGLLYFYLLCTVFYVGGYLTTQITTPENSTLVHQVFNRVSRDLNSTGMQKSIVAIDPMPPAYYDAADIVGNLYHNRLLLSRVSRYPFFLGMAERPDFQEIASDPQANELLATGSTVGEILANPKIKALLEDASIVDELKQLDVADLKTFVDTEKSPKYSSERMLGRWEFDISNSLEQTRLLQPSITPKRMLELNRELGAAFLDATFTAAPDGLAFIKSVPPPAPLKPGQPIPPLTTTAPKMVAKGKWSAASADYAVSFSSVDPHPLYQILKSPAKARFQEKILFIEMGNVVLAFTAEQ